MTQHGNGPTVRALTDALGAAARAYARAHRELAEWEAETPTEFRYASARSYHYAYDRWYARWVTLYEAHVTALGELLDAAKALGAEPEPVPRRRKPIVERTQRGRQRGPVTLGTPSASARVPRATRAEQAEL